MVQFNDGLVIFGVLLFGVIYKIIYLGFSIEDGKNGIEITNIIFDICIILSGMRFVWVSYHKELSDKIDKQTVAIQDMTKKLTDAITTLGNKLDTSITTLGNKLDTSIATLGNKMDTSIANLNTSILAQGATIAAQGIIITAQGNTLGDAIDKLGIRVRDELRTISNK